MGEYGATWWNENHPGVTAAGDLESDNVPLSGPGHHVRGNYNPLVQFQFVRHQARVSTVVSPPAERNNALVLRLLGWSTGHNPTGLCLFTDLGFKHPVPASFMNTKIPSAAVVGFLGRPDDTPYLETSNAVEWSTQEIWDVPFYYAIGLVSHLE